MNGEEVVVGKKCQNDRTPGGQSSKKSRGYKESESLS